MARSKEAKERMWDAPLTEYDWNILHWTDGKYFYSIYAQISQDEIVKIAENLKK